MRYFPKMVVCAIMLVMSCVVLADDQADEQAIKSVVAGFARSWNLPGMPGFGDLFTEDADFVVISGRWLKGRDESSNGYCSGAHRLGRDVHKRWQKTQTHVACGVDVCEGTGKMEDCCGPQYADRRARVELCGLKIQECTN